MSHFYGDLKGNRGKATRCGTANSGIKAHVRGWNVGCEAWCYTDGDVDVVEIYVTTGSNGRGNNILLGRYFNDNGKLVKV